VVDEQQFIVEVINYLQQHDAWTNTAVVIAYDDSGAWYDHAVPPIVNGSATVSDTLNGTNLCGTGVPVLSGPNSGTPRYTGGAGTG
jgi:phospholipase C